MTNRFLISERLRLRPLSGGDVPQFVRLFGNDPESLDMMNGLPWPMALESVRPWIERTSARSGRFGITRRKDGAFVGMVGWSLKDGEPRIGYLIGRDFRNRGYATEAIELIMEELAKQGHSTIFAETLPQNEASIRVLEKCGFIYNGRTEAKSERTGELREFLVYELEL